MRIDHLLLAHADVPSVIAAAIARVHYIAIQLRSSDPTFDAIPAAISTQVLMNYSLIAATIPCLKPFVISFNTGWGQGNHGKGSSYVLNSLTKRNGGDSGAPKSQTLASHHSQTGNNLRLRPDVHEHNWTIAHDDKETQSGRGEEADGSVASKESQQMIIRRTAGWSVKYEADDASPPPPTDQIGIAG
jgi:hypothetical protein